MTDIKQIIQCTETLDAVIQWGSGQVERRPVVGFALTHLHNQDVVFPLVFDENYGCTLLRPGEDRSIRYELRR